MRIFGNNDRKIIKQLRKKSEDVGKDISKEIDELLHELKTEYNQNSNVVNEFNEFANKLKSKLTPEDALQLTEFTKRISKVKQCAEKGVEAMRELARDQKKATRETIREYEEYLYV